MKERPLRTTVIGSYPFPGWLEYSVWNLDKFGSADREELVEDAVVVALHDQLAAGLDVVTDGEQTRLDFNLSFYGFLTGIELESASPRRFGPPAHDQRGKHQVTAAIQAPHLDEDDRTTGLVSTNDSARHRALVRMELVDMHPLRTEMNLPLL